MRRSRLLLIDNTTRSGATFTPKLVRMLERHANMHVVRSHMDTMSALRDDAFDGVVLSGSTEMLTERVDPDVLGMNTAVLATTRKPVLGICFGMQIMALFYGGTLVSLFEPCGGIHNIRVYRSVLFDCDACIDTRHIHADAVASLPPGFLRTATNRRHKRGGRCV